MFSYFMSGNSCSSKAIRLLSQQDNSALLNAMVHNSKAGQLLLYIYRITPGLILDIIATLPRFFVYQELARCNTEEYEYFAKFLACGQVTCLSVWPVLCPLQTSMQAVEIFRDLGQCPVQSPVVQGDIIGL